MIKKHYPILICLFLCLLAILSARIQSIFIGYLLILTIIVIIGLIGFKVLKPSSILLFGIALSILWSITLMGNWVVGTDVQEEIWCSQRAFLQGWDPFEAGVKQSNSSIIVGAIIPWITFATNIPIEWVYKIFPPIALAGAVCLLYGAYKKQVGDLKGFFATIFFIIVPVFSIETSQIAKSMVAEFFLALIIYAMVADWDQWTKSLVILGSFSLCMLSHYTIGIIAAFYLAGITGVRFVATFIKSWLFKNKQLKLVPLILVTFFCLSGLFVYYNKASDGLVIKVIDNVLNTYFKVDMTPDVAITPIVTANDAGNPVNEKMNIEKPSITNQPPIVKAGLNLDFMSISLMGKVFRVIQFMTQLLILIGGGWLLFKWKSYKFTMEYIAGIGCAFVILVLCIFMPYFSSLINMTRFYHLALFFLAPLFVIGVDCLTDDR